MTKQVVLITGTSRGLGRSLAKGLFAKGYQVISGVRDIKKAPPGTIPVQLDLTDEASLKKAVEEIIQSQGRIDVLIHNAGIAYVGPVDSMTLDEARNLFEVNFFGPFRLTQLVLPYMRQQKSGKIIFISSVRAVDSGPYIGLYSASKSALESIAFDCAVTLSKWNISVSVFQPGPIDTGIELKTGNYFKENTPYPSLGDIKLDQQPTDEVCNVVIEKLAKPNLPYKFQSSPAITNIVGSHLTDPSGHTWLTSQLKEFSSLIEE